jgi:hypothetical protein
VSLAATIVMCLGVGLFCGTGFRALDILLNVVFNNLFKLDLPWLKNIQIIFLLLGIIMGCFAIILLLFGFLSTGRTREKVCTGTKCVRGGIGIAVLFTIATYIINGAWLAMTAFSAVPIVLFIMLQSICQHEIVHRDYWFLDNYCLNMSRFGIYKNLTIGLHSDSLCDEIDLSQFCQSVYDAGPMFCFAFIGSCLIVLGMIIYLMALGSNISRIDSTKSLTDYRRAIEMEVAHTMETSSGNFLI